MATATDAFNYVKRTYDFIEYPSSTLGVEMDLGDLRTQLVFFDATDSHAIFSSAFASTSDVTAEEVFEYADISPWGVKLVGDNYCVVHLSPLENLDISEITAGFNLVALVADRIEKQISNEDNF
jgi:hypothetical protein